MELFQHLTFLFLCILLQNGPSRCGQHRHSGSFRTIFNSILSVDEDENLAMQHAQRIADSGSCELPKVQVVHVSDFYPGKYYLPHCTLLHRCGKHAGCCGTERLRCVAAAKEKVTLHFYSVRVVGHGMPVERSIEKLVFSNHTKCGCVPNEHVRKSDL